MSDYFVMIHKKENDKLDPLQQLPFIHQNDIKDSHTNIKGSLIPQNFGPDNVIFSNKSKDEIKETAINVSPEHKDIMELPLNEILKNISKSVIDIIAETIVVLHKEIPPEDKYNELTTFLKNNDRLIYLGLFFILISMIFSFGILI